MQSLNGHLRKQYGVDLYGVKNSDNLSDSFKQLSVNNCGRGGFGVLDKVRVKGKKKRIGFIFKKLIKGRYKVVIPREQKMLIVKQNQLQKVLKKYKHIETYINQL